MSSARAASSRIFRGFATRAQRTTLPVSGSMTGEQSAGHFPFASGGPQSRNDPATSTPPQKEEKDREHDHRALTRAREVFDFLADVRRLLFRLTTYRFVAVLDLRRLDINVLAERGETIASLRVRGMLAAVRSARIRWDQSKLRHRTRIDDRCATRNRSDDRFRPTLRKSFSTRKATFDRRTPPRCQREVAA
jgi:hypothetical protein